MASFGEKSPLISCLPVSGHKTVREEDKRAPFRRLSVPSSAPCVVVDWFSSGSS